MTTKHPSAFLIDLDDTLFSELSYVESGHRAVAESLAAKSTFSSEEIFQRLRYEFFRSGRNGAFDRLLSAFDINHPVGELVALYRSHSPFVRFYDGVPAKLKALKDIAPIAVVTDGATEMQQQKARALELDQYADAIVLCSVVGAPKPHTGAFEAAAKKLGADIEGCIVIGDDPYSDQHAAKALGAPFIRVRTGRFADIASHEAPPPLAEAPSFADLSPTSLLDAWRRR